MHSIKQNIYNNLPITFKNILVTVYNLRFFKIYGRKYQILLKEIENIFFNFSYEEIQKLQNDQFMKLIGFVSSRNPYYKKILKGIEIHSLKDINKLPVMIKDDLRNENIKSKVDDSIIKGYTGGTTGKSLSFGMTLDDYIQREATITFFRGIYSYQFKDKIAWFSGKEIITNKEVQKNIFWVKDLLNNITYYSTFHLIDEYIDATINNLNISKIEFMAGFPSAIYDIAKRWHKTGVEKKIKLKAIFPTSEPLHEYQKKFLMEFFDCPVPDQYASSEGAPFIYECFEGNLHYDMSSGIFEIIDPVTNEILVTSFTTHYMPLIRYKIGDSIIFDDVSKKCKCGSNMPLVKQIIGRSVSYVYSNERGRVTNSNIANVIKYMSNIEKMQLIQNKIDEIDINIVSNNKNLNKIENELEYELRYRLGDKIKFNYFFVNDIPAERNGKYLMVKNNITKLLE